MSRRRRRLLLTPSTSVDDAIVAIITGEGAYYRVSDLSTLFEDRGGATATTPASVDGLVGTIKDKGPNGRHLVATADAARGTLRLAGGVYYIEGNGTTTGYSTEALPSSAWAHYFGNGLRRRSAGNLGFQRRSSSTLYSRLEASATNNRAAMTSQNTGATGTTNAAISSVPLDTWAALDGLSVVGSQSVGVNGGAYVTTTPAFTDDAMLGVLSIFLNTAGGAQAVAADWAGGVYLNKEPTADERATINAMLTDLIS